MTVSSQIAKVADRIKHNIFPNTVTAQVLVVVSYLLPLLPKITASNLAEAVGFFGQKNPQHAFLQRGSKAVCPMSQICGM
jgi:hypothetical protein